MNESQRAVLTVLAVAAVAAVIWAVWPAGHPEPASAAPSLASIPYAGDNAVAKGCAGFGSEDAQNEGDRAAVAGDKDAFGTLVVASGGRHIAEGERVRVTGTGQKTDHRRVEDASGAGLWVTYNCLTKVP
jgi:hypothetical protein